MLAKVKDEYRHRFVQAFSGREFIKSEWRQVQAGFETEAKAHPFLDVDEKAPEPVKELEEDTPPQAPPKPRRTRAKK